MLFVAFETQPVVASVKTKLAVPAPTAVTTPPFVTVATEGLLLLQVPPVVGDSVDVSSSHKISGPETLTVGLANTVTGKVGSD